jgi:hypothetical protein
VLASQTPDVGACAAALLISGLLWLNLKHLPELVFAARLIRRDAAVNVMCATHERH